MRRKRSGMWLSYTLCQDAEAQQR